MRAWNHLIAGLGVLLVIGGCSVPGSEPPPPSESQDRQIEQRIARAFYTDPTASKSQVQIHVTNGQVRLTGFVHSREQRDRLEQLAASTPGVLQVSSELVLPTGRKPLQKQKSSGSS
jgi:hypothetical protein